MKQENEVLSQELNTILKEMDIEKPFASSAALGAINYCVSEYNEADWKMYADETGNTPLNKISISKSPINIAIDKATGYDEVNKNHFLKFAVWFARDFKKGLDN